jgi:eukaryotic-like serine/threonine-protein kinase
MVAAHKPPPDPTVVSYEETGLLAEGGMATLTQATSSLGLSVVIKRVRPPFCFDAGYLRLFRDEGRIHAALDHPHVVRLIDQGEDEAGLFLVFEHVDGTDLSVLAEHAQTTQECLPLELVLAVAIPLCDALAFVHEAQDEAGQSLHIIHRDISPGNVLLGDDGAVKLADFGVAASRLKNEVTVAGEMKGKFAYMAPEQTRGEAITVRADLFALGIVLWECLSGRRLFDAATDADIVQLVRTSSVPELSPSLPAALRTLVAELLSKQPTDRPASARLVHQRLRDIAMNQGLDDGLSRCVARAVRMAPRRTVTALAPDVRRRTRRVRDLGTAATKVVIKKQRPQWVLPAASAVAAMAGAAAWWWWPVAASTTTEPVTVVQLDDGMTLSPDRSDVPAVPVAGVQAPMLAEALPRGDVRLARDRLRPIAVTAPIAPIISAPVPPEEPLVRDGVGKLSISSEPWARVSIDGVLVDNETPLVGHVLPAGKHTVVLENPIHNLKKTIVVDVPRDGHLRQPVDLNTR